MPSDGIGLMSIIEQDQLGPAHLPSNAIPPLSPDYNFPDNYNYDELYVLTIGSYGFYMDDRGSRAYSGPTVAPPSWPPSDRSSFQQRYSDSNIEPIA